MYVSPFAANATPNGSFKPPCTTSVARLEDADCDPIRRASPMTPGRSVWNGISAHSPRVVQLVLDSGANVGLREDEAVPVAAGEMPLKGFEGEKSGRPNRSAKIREPRERGVQVVVDRHLEPGAACNQPRLRL